MNRSIAHVRRFCHTTAAAATVAKPIATGGGMLKSATATDFLHVLQNSPQLLKAIQDKHRPPVKDTKYYATKTVELGRKVGGWAGKAITWVKERPSRPLFRTPEERAERKRKKAEARQETDARLQNFYLTQELCTTIKLREVTVDEGADFVAFSNRICTQYKMYKREPAFPFLGFRVAKPGTLPSEEPPYVMDPDGSVTIEDRCTAEEFLEFLRTVAPNAQKIQRARNDMLEKMAEQIMVVHQRLGITELKFELQPKGEVTPADVMRVCNTVLRAPQLYRGFLKDAVLEVRPCIAPHLGAETIVVPPSLDQHLWDPQHEKYRRLEQAWQLLRKLRFIGFLIAITLVGDVEWD